MDIVDNSASPGDRRGPAPRTGRERQPHGGGQTDPVPRPGDGGSGSGDNGGDTAGGARREGTGDAAGGRRGSDLARDALKAAREQSAKKAAERKAEGLPKLKVVSGKGRRRRWSGSGPDDRDPQPFGRIVSRVSMDRGWSPRLTDATVIGRWPQLVGPDISDHCTPISLRDGELTLQAESTAWATQLRTLQRQLLTRLAAAVGPDVVRRIRVVAPSGPSWRHGPRHVRGRGPRDTYG
ncbi:uncharacterized protein DUF721 [Pseudonocardia sediminis]|uniref:Uncharacterized protein DUF721 n=1 Tax=Pseudonocardia sediminis TaxID=1397368 RepID=A0A4Q7UNF4_PSEST|nr:uncharacterized protein DUF721 [Pseudonocardia sediminis]